MRIIRIFTSLLIIIILWSCHSVQAQKTQNWTQQQLMEPAELAQTIARKDIELYIFSVGPGALIPNSIDIGMTTNEKNLEIFKNEISPLSKTANIVIYCGCCPFEKCPNVRPAIDILKKMKFTNYHLLNLPNNIKTDWIAKGYPIVE